MIKKNGVLTLPTILFYNGMKTDLESIFKNCAIMFDDVKLITASVSGAIVSSAGEDSHVESAVKSLLKESAFFQSNEFKKIFKYDSEFDLYSNELIADPSGENSFNSDKNKELFSLLVSKVVDKYETKIPKSDPRYDLTIGFYKNLILNNYSIFEQLTEKNPELSSLMSPIFRNLVFEVSRARLESPQDVIKEVEKINLIDFAQFTWDEILELRSSEFAKDFRIKFSELVSRFGRNIDTKTLNYELNKFIIDSKFRFISDNKPDLKRTVFRTLLGKVPIPKFLNPIAVYDSVDRIDKERYLGEEYGWIYFIEDVYEKQNRISR